jgi:hypothetical protein
MRSRSNYPIQVLAAGFLVLMFLSLSLFWASWLCKSFLAGIMPMDYRTVDITPSGLVPAEIESDQYVPGRSGVHAHIMDPGAPQTLGIANYLSSKAPEGRHSRIYYFSLEGENTAWIYFDERIGQMNCRWADAERMPDGTVKLKMVQIYAGPEGISETPDEDIGRFTSPVVDVSIGRGQLTLYDKKLRQFFAVKFHKKVELIKGPQLSEDDSCRPVDIGMPSKNPSVLDMYWLPPNIKTSQNHQSGVPYSGAAQVLIRERHKDYEPDRYVLVLDESGRIDLLDRETLEFAGTAGRLPAPETFFPADKRVTPDDLLAYRVLPIALKEDHKYSGLLATAVSREGTALALAVFDEKGACIGSEITRAKNSRGGRGEPSSRAVFFGTPWSPVLTIGKFLLENLHPPILSLASYFTAGSIEAASGHRAMFLLPNSFIAMKGRDARGNIAARFLSALLLILPSIVLAILLAGRVDKDAAVVGLPQQTRRFWTLGTIAFGLAGYITYKITRPKVTLVTCANCGKPRRTDMDKCHRCGSKWDVPELTPPVWRVLNGAE